jgi:hypothetical protein
MIHMLTTSGYVQTKAKLAGLEQRLANLEKRTDLSLTRLEAVRKSYRSMMRKYRREIELYETSATTEKEKNAN